MVLDMDLVREVLLWVEAFRPDIPQEKRFTELRLSDFSERVQRLGDDQFFRIKHNLFKWGLLETITWEGTAIADLTWDGLTCRQRLGR